MIPFIGDSMQVWGSQYVLLPLPYNLQCRKSSATCRWLHQFWGEACTHTHTSLGLKNEIDHFSIPQIRLCADEHELGHAVLGFLSSWHGFCCVAHLANEDGIHIATEMNRHCGLKLWEIITTLAHTVHIMVCMYLLFRWSNLRVWPWLYEMTNKKMAL